jgi:hypothetical protein
MGRTDRRWTGFLFCVILLLVAGEMTVSIALKGTGLLLPVAFVLSLFIGRLGRRTAIFAFGFAIPVVGALPALVRPELPFNYVPVLLMVVAGLALARPRSLVFMIHEPLMRAYYLWFGLLVLGTVFVLLRWSTFAEGALRLFPDLLTSPAGDRISFTLLFPILTLTLYGLAPLILGLKRELGLTPERAFRPFMIGFFVSALVASLQQLLGFSILTRQSWMATHYSNGLASDFNALGLLSGLAFFFALLLLASPPRRPLNGLNRWLAYTALPVSIVCAWWSNSRTALLIFIVALLWLAWVYRARLLTRPLRWLWLGLMVLMLAGLAVPRFRAALVHPFQPRPGQTWMNRMDELSNHRITMLRDGLETIRLYPLSGVGPGNYLFFQRYKHFQQYFLHDLPLNQFLLILLEGGIFSLLWFLIWLFAWFLRSRGPWRVVLFSLLLSFLVGTPLWLPEGMVLFWLVLAFGLNPRTAGVMKNHAWRVRGGLAVLGLFLVVNLVHFKSLDPSTWQLQHRQQNAYGLWTPDPGMEGVFAWTRGAGGLFVTGGESQPLRIACGAPLGHLPGKKQTVQLYWQGVPLQTLVFTENNDRVITLPQGESGWLEFTVEPVFVLKDLNLGPETRGLGVQLHFR